MFAAIQGALDVFLGRGEAAVTVPVMDGPLKPNRALDAARSIASAPALDNLLPTAAGVCYTSGPALLTLSGETVARFEHDRPQRPGGQNARRGQTRRAGSDDDRIRVHAEQFSLVSSRTPQAQWSRPSIGRSLSSPTHPACI